jgi:hypothetical protein
MARLVSEAGHFSAPEHPDAELFFGSKHPVPEQFFGSEHPVPEFTSNPL